MSFECGQVAACNDCYERLESFVVRGLIGWMGAFLAGSAGWWLGAKVGLGTAVVLGAVASGVGLYAGNRWFDQNLK
jgi:hypothetical protein